MTENANLGPLSKYGGVAPQPLTKTPQTSAAVAKSSGERVFTVDQLAKLFNVSTKTISRWRSVGLEGRMFDFGGRKQLGFPRKSVAQFIRENPKRVKRGSQFSQMTEDERAQIVEDAAALARGGWQPNEIVKQLAEKSGRSAEAVRYTLKRHDQEHPMSAILSSLAERQSTDVAPLVYAQHLQGADVAKLAKRFRRSKAAITRLIKKERASRIFELPLEFMASPEFEEPNAEQRFTGPLPDAQRATRKARAPSDLPAYLASLYDTPLLTAEQEKHLFRKYNFLKFRADQLRETLDPDRPSGRVMDEIERLYDQAVATKNRIVRANLRLVVSIVKRYTHDAEGLFERVSEGNVSLMRAVEKFDYTRGFKFSTYATWAIKKNYARTAASEAKRRERFQLGGEEVMIDRADQRADPFKREAAHRRSQSAINKILGCLNDRERQIISERFGLSGREGTSTLKEVGAELGVSKERVRQLESRAMAKLRKAAESQRIEPPEEGLGA